MKAILTVGISASGKTTWAEQYCKDNQNTVNINRDDLRFEMFCNGIRDWSLYKFTKERENQVTIKQEQLIAFASSEGKDIIISDTNLNPKTVNHLKEVLTSYNYEVEEKVFYVDLVTALERDAKRPNGVGYKTITQQYEKFCEKMFNQDYHTHYNGKKDAVIFDIDGTLADMSGIRGPFEWDKVGLDKPHTHVVSMAKFFKEEGYDIIFMSGRDAVCLEDTRQWLDNYTGITDGWLFMRAVGDMRKDTIVKKELFNTYVDNNFNIHFVVDDRPSVLRMWKYELGLNVLAVGNPWREF